MASGRPPALCYTGRAGCHESLRIVITLKMMVQLIACIHVLYVVKRQHMRLWRVPFRIATNLINAGCSCTEAGRPIRIFDFVAARLTKACLRDFASTREIAAFSGLRQFLQVPVIIGMVRSAT